MLLKQTRFLLATVLVGMLLLNSSVVFAQGEGEGEPTQPADQTVTNGEAAQTETPAAAVVEATATVEATPTSEPTPALPDYQETYEGLPLCAPGIYLIAPVDCLPMGPSETLTKWAREGIHIPEQPLIASHPNASFYPVDRQYAKLNVSNGVQAAWYPSLDAAITGWGASNYVPIGTTLYVSYDGISYNGNDAYVQNEYGEWIRASPTNYSDFSGLVFDQPPANDFGWIIDVVSPRKEPSYYAEAVNEELVRNTIVQVYDQTEAEGSTWYMIGIGKWVEARALKVIDPKQTAPDGVENGRWIYVDLYQQTLSVYEDNRLKFATIIATGYEPYYTQPGLFQIREKKDYETMTGAFATGKTDYYLLEDVPWTMYYDGPRALHGAYWRALFGYEQSHGCVNLSITDAHWLYDWAEVGDWVYVYDPSGATPTDPSFYTVNAAF